jgi:ankyrin repeat protein
VRLLIENSASVNMQDEAYSTPLHLASSQASTETVAALIEKGADVTAMDGDHRTPLHLASAWASAKTASSLMILM